MVGGQVDVHLLEGVPNPSVAPRNPLSSLCVRAPVCTCATPVTSRTVTHIASDQGVKRFGGRVPKG